MSYITNSFIKVRFNLQHEFCKWFDVVHRVWRCELFKKIIFGSYLNIPNYNYQSQITKCLLLLARDWAWQHWWASYSSCKRKYITFHYEGIHYYYWIEMYRQYCNFKYSKFTPSKLIQKHFSGSKTNVSKALLVQRFQMGRWQNNKNVLQMTILYFMHTFIFSLLGDTTIPIDDFIMIEDGRYEQFPRGNLHLPNWWNHWGKSSQLKKQAYQLTDMPYALCTQCLDLRMCFCN